MLLVSDIEEWLQQNEIEYEKLKAFQYPPLDNEVYFMYPLLREFHEYSLCDEECKSSLHELKQLLQHNNFSSVSTWIIKYENLGSEKLLLFETTYLDWVEQIDNDKIKISEGLYVERKPFRHIVSFCEIFNDLYWNRRIHETALQEDEKIKLRENILAMLTNLH